jgi:hypothetical protein
LKGKVTRLLEYPLEIFSASEESVASIFKVEEVSPTGVVATAIVVMIMWSVLTAGP